MRQPGTPSNIQVQVQSSLDPLWPEAIQVQHHDHSTSDHPMLIHNEPSIPLILTSSFYGFTYPTLGRMRARLATDTGHLSPNTT